VGVVRPVLGEGHPPAVRVAADEQAALGSPVVQDLDRSDLAPGQGPFQLDLQAAALVAERPRPPARAHRVHGQAFEIEAQAVHSVLPRLEPHARGPRQEVAPFPKLDRDVVVQHVHRGLPRVGIGGGGPGAEAQDDEGRDQQARRRSRGRVDHGPLL